MRRQKSISFLRRATRLLPRVVLQCIQVARGRAAHEIPFGSVRFGDFGRLSPIGSAFGWGRGTPVDRHYIESFLSQNADAIRGSVLELGDNRYTRHFGNDRVEQSDILSVETDNPNATIVGDLTQAGTLPEAKFDCIILTQVFQLIFDIPVAVDSLHRALKPGGVLLVTAPGITPMGIKIERWSHVPWYWAVTAATLRRLLEARFDPGAVSVESHGNVLAATAFLYGMAVEELDISDVNFDDSTYPVIVTARAVKQQDALQGL
jgi:methyltransferase family protein